jgi:DNA (cytosine-5)-methyltransferase 1
LTGFVTLQRPTTKENLVKYKILSLFTGAGGMDIGFHGDFNYLNKHYSRLPFDTCFATDYNAEAIKSLEYNDRYFDKKCVKQHADITELSIADVKRKVGEIDVLLGGFPCVTFSVVGKQAGVEDSKNGQLYEKFAEYVEAFRPKVFVAENVKGILSANQGEAIKIIESRFKMDGYNLEYRLVNFADYGVPQLRQRVVFVGTRTDIAGNFLFPEPTHKGKHVTVKEAFKGLKPNLPNSEHLKQLDRTRQIIAAIPEGGNHEDLPPELKVRGLMSNIYRRLDSKKPSYTMIASGGGGTWGYHYSEPRALTNRERARIQGFPDDYVFQGSTTEVRRQIGNAVPPVGIYPFAQAVASFLNDSDALAFERMNSSKEPILAKSIA